MSRRIWFGTKPTGGGAPRSVDAWIVHRDADTNAGSMKRLTIDIPASLHRDDERIRMITQATPRDLLGYLSQLNLADWLTARAIPTTPRTMSRVLKRAHDQGSLLWCGQQANLDLLAAPTTQGTDNDKTGTPQSQRQTTTLHRSGRFP